MLADEVVGLATQVYKQLETTGGTLASVDDVCHVRGQNERSSVPDGKVRGEERRFKFGFRGKFGQKVIKKEFVVLV